MNPIVIFGVLLLSTPAPKTPSLQGTVDRVAAAMLKQDWSAFRKDATPTITFEEYYTAYEQYFDKSFVRDPSKGVLGMHQMAYVGNMSAVPNKPALSATQMGLFLAYCNQVKDSRGYTSRAWGHWPTIRSDNRSDAFDAAIVAGPRAFGTIASNVEFAITFEKWDGKWKARRLILVGH